MRLRAGVMAAVFLNVFVALGSQFTGGGISVPVLCESAPSSWEEYSKQCLEQPGAGR